MSEPLVMRGILSLSAAFWTANTPSLDKEIVHESLYQKSQAIREINSQISKLPVSDAVIVAVCNLANVAAMEGSFTEAETRVRGLRRLVDSRGGAMTFKDTSYVARAMNWQVPSKIPSNIHSILTPP